MKTLARFMLCEVSFTRPGERTRAVNRLDWAGVGDPEDGREMKDGEKGDRGRGVARARF